MSNLDPIVRYDERNKNSENGYFSATAPGKKGTWLCVVIRRKKWKLRNIGYFTVGERVRFSFTSCVKQTSE